MADTDDTQDTPFDMETFVADLLEKEESDDATDVVEDGPGEEPGELPEEDDDDVPGEPEGDPEEDESPEDDVDPESEDEDDARTDELALLKKELAETRQQQQQLLDLLLKKEQQTKPEPKALAEYDDVSDDVADAALWGGGDRAKWEGLDPQTKARAQALATSFKKRLTKFAKNKQAYYQEELRDLIMEDLNQVLKPLVQAHYQRRSKEIFKEHASDLEAHKDRLAKVFVTVPGHDSSDFEDVEKALKFAADRVRTELKEQGLLKRERKVETAQRQKDANRRARKRNRRRGSNRAPSTNNVEGWDPSQTLLSYAEKISKEDI